MDEHDYLAASSEFLSGGFHPEKVPTAEVHYMLSAAKVAADWCDRVKRGLFYGKDIALRSSHASMTSVQLDSNLANLIHGIIGAFGEAGEMMEHLHKVLSGECDVDPVNLLEEIGDLEWYLACVHRFIGTRPSQAYTTNIAKLDKRYPGRSWSAERALNRDTLAEREVLENGAAERPASDLPEPVSGSYWQHRSGAIYRVIGLANLHDNPRYPRTIVYEGENGHVWARRADDWHRSMAPAPAERVALETGAKQRSVMTEDEDAQYYLAVLDRILIEAKTLDQAKQWASAAIPDDAYKAPISPPNVERQKQAADQVLEENAGVLSGLAEHDQTTG